MVIGQLLLVYLLHIFVLRRQVLELYRFGSELILQFFVVVAHASQLQLELFANLIHLHAFLGLQVDTLFLELVAQLTLSITSHNHCLLIAAHLSLQQFLEVRVFLEQPLYFLL